MRGVGITVLRGMTGPEPAGPGCNCGGRNLNLHLTPHPTQLDGDPPESKLLRKDSGISGSESKRSIYFPCGIPLEKSIFYELF